MLMRATHSELNKRGIREMWEALDVQNIPITDRLGQVAICRASEHISFDAAEMYLRSSAACDVKVRISAHK